MNTKEWIESRQAQLFAVADVGFAEHGRGLIFVTIHLPTGIAATTYVSLMKCREATRIFKKAIPHVETYDVAEECVVVIGKDGEFERGAVLCRRRSRPEAGEFFN